MGVINTYPASDALGIPTGVEILVYFEEEIDLSSINSGTVVVTSPDNTSVFGGDLESFQEVAGSDHNSVTSSLPLNNVVDGTFRFLKANSSNVLIETDIEDTTGDGTLWRTVAVFTPSVPLLPNIEYTVNVSGDEDNNSDFSSGVRLRSVFDPTETVSGTGTATFSGSYTGTSNATYTVEIQTSGVTGVATYNWWNNADPLTIYSGTTTTGDRKLEDGLIVSFGADGTFVSGDTWEVLCIPYESIGSTYEWSFTTGNGNIVTPSSEYSTTGIEAISTSASSGVLTVTDITPVGGKYGVPISTDPYTGNTITITFDSLLDEDTLIGTISVVSEGVLADSFAVGELDFEATLVDYDLIINILPDQLYNNNIVIVTLDKSIANTDGVSFDEDYISYFSTPYTPLYTTYRRILLDLGASLDNILEETVYYAILEASIEVDVFTFATVVNSQYYNYAKRQYATCLAELYLVNGLILQGGADRFSKRLGDLSVSRNGNLALDKLKDDLRECLSLWKAVLESGGAITPDTSIASEFAVKGKLADDAITVSRQWEPTSTFAHYPAANTTKSTLNSRRRLRSYRPSFGNSSSCKKKR
jgi:hypothetical protein